MNARVLIIFLLSAYFIISGCQHQAMVKIADGMVVTLKLPQNGTSKIRLQVVNDNIIRVTAVPGDVFDKSPDLITACTTKTEGWEITTEGDAAILRTATLKASVSLSTGEIVFSDHQGHTLLKENAGGGKTFVPMEVDGEKAWTVRQIFESPADEAFYGLGQHQSDEFNYKGRNETLYQYNTKVSVPFVVSNKNYGVLWNNYSLTRFGDPRDYAQLDQFTLYNKAGKEGGLTATYIVNGGDFRKALENNSSPLRVGGENNIFIEREEKTIDYEDLEKVKNFPDKFSFDKSAIVWEGFIEPKETGVYRFILYYAGYTTVYLDDQQVVAERWRTAWNPNSYKFTANLKAGQKHKIRLEWRPDGGVSYIGLKALSPVDPAEQEKLSLWSEMADQIDYYFIHGNNMDEVVSGYRTVTGKAQVMPKWSMGFWQSRERYKTQTELLDVLHEFRKRQIPVDNIVQDWSYWPENAWGSHDFDPARFPDPQGMVDEVHRLNARLMISVWPKFYYTTQHYKEFDEKGWMYRRAVNDSIRDWIGRGYVGSFYDAYSEGARQLFWKQMDDKLYRYGIDAWWMDASEPDVLSNASMAYRKELMNPTALGSSTRYFNAYGLMNAKGIYEGQRGANNRDRVFLLTRSGFAGSQKYAAVIWSGDIGTRWEDMKAQISAGLNFSVSGNPYWTMDNGGFCVEKRYERAKDGSEDMDEWRELNVRWHQFGAFAPLFRTHGQYPFREVWNIAPESHPAYKTIVNYTKLRYRLMPYVYSLAGMAHFNDYTIMRPLVMDFPGNPEVINIGDQYMFGPALMACPVYQYKARTRELYLPAGCGWYDFYSGKYLEGGQTITADAPYDRMPVFAACGAIVPVGDLVQHTGEKQTNLDVLVYAGKNGTFTLYEDEGVNYNYEDGACSFISFTYNDRDRALTIGERKGAFTGMAAERKFRMILVDKQRPASLETKVDGIEINYNGTEQVVKFP